MINKNLIILCYHGVSNCKRNFGIENFSGKHILKLRTSPVSVRTYQTGDRTLYKRIRSFLALLYKNSLVIDSIILLIVVPLPFLP